ncbi:hypothetical protein B7P33_14485 [Sediminicola luteus]|uniref:Lysoplasmalogenase n=2 Tax=Sediminicola luteus TaxID=319238 RepID=A0A2A4G371_9FLAO|nr:hypothetical protein B7P33_14485 [Sediminicola luteus]
MKDLYFHTPTKPKSIMGKLDNFSWIFACILAFELVVINVPALAELRMISKPAIVISLLVFVSTRTFGGEGKLLLLLALLFCLAGDLFLMFDGYFVAGLAAFLVGHVFYTLLLFHNNGLRSQGILLLSACLALLVGVILYLVLPQLGELLPYVIAYMLVISAMAISSFTTKVAYPKLAFTLCLVGALLFVISDSLLALNAFYKPFEGAGTAVMATYGLAQYFLVRGVVKAKA